MTARACAGCGLVITGRTYYCADCRAALRRCRDCGGPISQMRHSHLCPDCAAGHTRQRQRTQAAERRSVTAIERDLNSTEPAPGVAELVEAHLAAIRASGGYRITDEMIWARPVDWLAQQAPDTTDLPGSVTQRSQASRARNTAACRARRKQQQKGRAA